MSDNKQLTSIEINLVSAEILIKRLTAIVNYKHSLIIKDLQNCKDITELDSEVNYLMQAISTVRTAIESKKVELKIIELEITYLESRLSQLIEYSKFTDDTDLSDSCRQLHQKLEQSYNQSEQVQNSTFVVEVFIPKI
jgi:regulator of replication initiation timing